MNDPDDQYGPITRLFTLGQIECLVRTAGEAVHGNAIAYGSLSARQIRLSRRAYDALMAEYEADGEQTQVSHADLRADAIRLGDEIDGLTRIWDATTEVSADLGNDIERAGRSLICLADQLAPTIARSDPARERQLRQFSAILAEAVDYYADLPEHETSASIDIFDQLGHGIALVLRIVREPEEPATARRVTTSELIDQLRKLPPHYEVWVPAPGLPEGYQALTGQAHLGDDPHPAPGDPRHFIVLS